MTQFHSHAKRVRLPVALVPGLLVAVLIAGCASFGPAADLMSVEREHPELVVAHSDSSGMSYLLSLPDCGGADSPLVVFLHSMEERGNLLALALSNPDGEGRSLTSIASSKPNVPFATVTPLLPARTFWFFHHHRIAALIEELAETYEFDRDRIYVTGVSMGGMGTFSFVAAYPDLVAAAIPVAGGIYCPPMCGIAGDLASVPILAFHDRNDPSIPVRKSEDAVRRIRRAGGDARLVYTESGSHYIQERVYALPETFDWMLAQRRRSKSE